MASNGDIVELLLVCDISGSMAEGGKCMLVRGIARAVEQYVRFGYAVASIKLVAWCDTATFVKWNPDAEFPDHLLQCHGSASAVALCGLIGCQPVGKVLLLTDGFWSIEDARCLKRWKRSLPPETLRIIKIGGDANPLLKGDDVFLSDEVFLALDGWLPSRQGADAMEDEW